MPEKTSEGSLVLIALSSGARRTMRIIIRPHIERGYICYDINNKEIYSHEKTEFKALIVFLELSGHTLKRLPCKLKKSLT